MRSRLIARIVDGHLTELAAEPPLAAKLTARPDRVELILVGAAASLLEGDALTIDVHVEGAVPVEIRSVAAQLAHPCPGGGATEQRIVVRASRDARVLWAVEPLVVAAGGRHRNVLVVELHDSSSAVVLDVAVLGRHGEDHRAALLETELRACTAGRPLLHDGLDTSLPGAHGPSGLGGHRIVATAAALGWPATRADGDLGLAGPGTLRRALSDDAVRAIDACGGACARWWAEIAG